MRPQAIRRAFKAVWQGEPAVLEGMFAQSVVVQAVDTLRAGPKIRRGGERDLVEGNHEAQRTSGGPRLRRKSAMRRMARWQHGQATMIVKVARTIFGGSGGLSKVRTVSKRCFAAGLSQP